MAGRTSDGGRLGHRSVRSPGVGVLAALEGAGLIVWHLVATPFTRIPAEREPAMSIRTHTRRPATPGTVNRFTNIAAGVTGEWLGWSPIGWSRGIAVHGIAVRLSRPVRSSQTHEGAGA